ncbi:MAG TPA: hypothetical protein VFC00_40110 [Micromonosporaceae bacterium]|nr:hypothetical protein [Micromonosporaceae bacterium]
MAVATGGRLAQVEETPKESWSKTVRRSWPIIKPITVQIGLAAVVSLAIALVAGLRAPFVAPLVAVATVEVICARHHRRIVEMIFAGGLGLVAGAAFNPDWPAADLLSNAAAGSFVAVVVAIATTPGNPVPEVYRTIDPLLALVAHRVRTVAAALRTGDMAAAGEAVYALNDCEAHLRRLDETLVAVRRSMLLAYWRRGQDLPRATTTATEIGHAVRHTRAMAVQAWWGVLRGGEHVPAALPPMLDAMADGIAVLRGEIRQEGPLEQTRRLLISSAQWVVVMRKEPLGMAAATVAGNADAAILNFLIATGLPLEAAENAIHRPS